MPLGLSDSEHTRNDGYKLSNVWELNELGQVRGASDRFNGGSADLGESAWLYNGATTIDVGLVGPEHSRNDGYKYSYAYHLNNAGQVSGVSDRYNGGSVDLGSSAWLSDGTTTIDIGLTGRSTPVAMATSKVLPMHSTKRGRSSDCPIVSTAAARIWA